MSKGLNKVMLIGYLGADPDVRNTQSGDNIVTISLATSESWKDRDGNRQQHTEWHRVVIFGSLANVASQYLTKGSCILVEGKLRTRKWTNQQGHEQYTTEVILSGFNSNLTMLGDSNKQDFKHENKSNFDHQLNNLNNDKINNDKSDFSPSSSLDDFSDLDDDIPF